MAPPGVETAPISFGFGLSPYARFADPAELVQTVMLAEELGYHTVGLPEHLLPPAAPTTPQWMKVWYDQAVLGAFIAAHTSRITLMPGVHVVPYHPPVQAAKALATLSIVSGGRLNLAVGVGWYQAEFERLAVPFHQRGAITDEYLRAMKELWTSDQPQFAGKFVSFAEASFLPQPAAIPLYIGGTADSSLRRVAEYGDGWYPMTDSPDVLYAGIKRIAGLRKKFGRAEAPLTAVCSLMVSEDPDLAVLRRHVRFETPQELATDTATAASLTRAQPERQSPSACIERIDELAAAGANLIMVKFAWANASELQAELGWFAAHVMPAFRQKRTRQ
jgi:probable F420-dependent oxidoreductase